MKAVFANKFRRFRNRRGFSLLDVIIATVVLLIAIVGTSSYRSYSSLDQRKAKMQTTAARIAQTLCETWRGASGDTTLTTFNPTSYTWPDMTISGGAGPAVPSGFTSLGSYAIKTNTWNYTTTLSWQNVAGSAGLRALNVTVAWPTSGAGAANSSFTLTSYTTY